ncbi:sensor histidine kinase [Friedmanniella luteola]|uniref:sensor histidine kinase n=1 Tax=Friedmanniella luteola TaxID=546871 RepID=UPI000B820A6B|nr:histidine kinase [Friedmanniella luteola]
MGRWGFLARNHALDAVTVLLTITSVLELMIGGDAPTAPEMSLGLEAVALVAMVLPLFVRRRFPFGAPAAYWLLAAAISLADGPLIPSVNSVFVLGMAAAFLLGNVRDPRKGRIGLVLVLACMVVVISNLPGHTISQLVFTPLPFAISWLAGSILQERVLQAEAAEDRAARAEKERDMVARVAVAEERARVARELHDIVAHAISVMVLQVGAVRHGLPAGMADQSDALRGVERVGRTALTEMRRLLAAMRPEGEAPELEPQPGLDNLNALIAEIGRAGLPASLEVRGERVPLPQTLDLFAYRIAQEGLTNVLKHAQAHQAALTLDYQPGALEIEVRDDGVGASASDGFGRGLVGVRERVKIYGGEMSAGPAGSGGFVLTARLPIGPDQP